MGDAIAANLFMLGFAYQKGHVPVSAQALLKAIEINGVAIHATQAAFRWGRKAALDLAAVTRAAMPAQPVLLQRPQNLKALLEDRTAFLTAHQNAAYANRYRCLVERVRAVKQQHRKTDVFTKAVASSLFRLLAPLRFLRSTAFDPFGRTEERRQERQLAKEYVRWLEDLLPRFTEADFDAALGLARLREQVRGFGPVKQASMASADMRRESPMQRLYAKKQTSTELFASMLETISLAR